jgi:hypothetical protein
MTEKLGPVEFNLELEEVEVKLNREGQTKVCVLREMDGYQRDLYLNSQRGKIERGTTNLKDFSDVQSSLISKCLFDKASGEQVKVDEIRQFPSRVQMKLYKMCMQLCGFDVEAEDDAKNV